MGQWETEGPGRGSHSCREAGRGEVGPSPQQRCIFSHWQEGSWPCGCQRTREESLTLEKGRLTHPLLGEEQETSPANNTGWRLTTMKKRAKVTKKAPFHPRPRGWGWARPGGTSLPPPMTTSKHQAMAVYWVAGAQYGRAPQILTWGSIINETSFFILSFTYRPVLKSPVSVSLNFWSFDRYLTFFNHAVGRAGFFCLECQ